MLEKVCQIKRGGKNYGFTGSVEDAVQECIKLVADNANNMDLYEIFEIEVYDSNLERIEMYNWTALDGVTNYTWMIPELELIDEDI